MPSRPATASRCTAKLVEPPIAELTTTAFSSARLVTTSDSRTFSRTSSTARMPDRWARARRRESTAGSAAMPGRVSPSDSAQQAMVEAVPMVLQWPAERDMHASVARNSSADMAPVRRASANRHTSVPEPSWRPR